MKSKRNMFFWILIPILIRNGFMFFKNLVNISVILLLTVTPSYAISSNSYSHRIVASWYSSGRRTASGQHFNPNGFSVAHRTLPFGTKIHLTNPRTGKSIVAIVNDRGPFVRGRGLDVSKGGARALGFIGQGQTTLVYEILR